MRASSARLTAALVLLGAGCTDATAPASRELHDRLGAWAPSPSATVLQAAQSGLTDPTLAMVSLPEEWRAMWTKAWAGSAAVPAMPEFDFVLVSVAVVGLGKRAGAGQTVTIDSIVVRTVGATLHATATQPGANCGGAAGSSSPVHMVLVPGHPPVVTWQISNVRRDCPSPASGR
jgi:hypothetical protein